MPSVPMRIYASLVTKAQQLQSAVHAAHMWVHVACALVLHVVALVALPHDVGGMYVVLHSLIPRAE